MMETEADPDVMDAVLIALAQKIEHYEIATYGTLCTSAEKLRTPLPRSCLAKTSIRKRRLTSISLN